MKDDPAGQTNCSKVLPSALLQKPAPAIETVNHRHSFEGPKEIEVALIDDLHARFGHREEFAADEIEGRHLHQELVGLLAAFLNSVRQPR